MTRRRERRSLGGNETRMKHSLGMVLSVLTVCVLMGMVVPSPRPKPARPNPILPTPKHIPKTQSPRFFVAGSAETQLVWTLRNPPVGDTFAYYYIELPSGTLKELRYDLSIDQSGSGMLLTLSRNGLRCRTYRARFLDNDEQVLFVQGGVSSADRPQGFSVFDDDELALSIHVLQEGAAIDSAWYRDMRKHHYKIGGPAPLPDIDPRFTPPC